MAYTPELTQDDSALLRRLAWTSGTPMTTTLHEALAFVAQKVPRSIVCERCKDKSRSGVRGLVMDIRDLCDELEEADCPRPAEICPRIVTTVGEGLSCTLVRIGQKRRKGIKRMETNKEKITIIQMPPVRSAWILTDGQEIDDRESFFDWEAEEANERAFLATDHNWKWQKAVED